MMTIEVFDQSNLKLLLLTDCIQIHTLLHENFKVETKIYILSSEINNFILF